MYTILLSNKDILEKKFLKMYNLFFIFSMDVYSFLSSPTSPNNLTETISTLVNKSRADIENNGVLNQEYAAQIVCILSQYVDRYVFKC